MPLIKCLECRKSVSDRAAACPHCGHPVTAEYDYGPSGGLGTLGLGDKPKPKGNVGAVILVLIGLIVVVVAVNSSSNTGSKTALPPGCKSDWHLCSDNADLVNNYSDISYGQVSCKMEATKRAKYGTPEWPWLPFNHFYPGSSVKNGTVALIEPDAKFSNGFGAMVHSRVTCMYDLNTRQVTDAIIAPN
jgi:hypothetical protein